MHTKYVGRTVKAGNDVFTVETYDEAVLKAKALFEGPYAEELKGAPIDIWRVTATRQGQVTE